MKLDPNFTLFFRIPNVMDAAKEEIIVYQNMKTRTHEMQKEH
jgi:hypothetical protein